MKRRTQWHHLLQWVALILLPALAVLAHGVAELYVWPTYWAARIVGTLNLMGVFLGAILQGQRYRQRRIRKEEKE